MRYLSLFALAALLTACHDAEKTATATTPAIQLSENSMFVKDSVMLAARENNGPNKKADKLFMKAIDTYRNDKKPGASIDYFKKSILLQPQAKAYFEMGNALMDMGKNKEALQSFQLAEALNYKPLSKVLYNTACVWSKLNETDSSIYYVVSAIEFGYANTNNIFNDPDLRNAHAEYNFALQVKKALAGSSDPDKLQWNLFSHELPQLELPVVMDLKYGNNQSFQSIPFDYERFIAEMRTVMFSRETGVDFFYVGTVKSSDSVKTIVYASQDLMYEEMDGDEHSSAPFTYYAASFTNHGKLIDKMQIGGRTKITDPIKVPTIQPNGDIDITLFQVTYEKNPEDSGYHNNKIKEQKEAGKEGYSIAQDGHFVAKNNALTMR